MSSIPLGRLVNDLGGVATRAELLAVVSRSTLNEELSKGSVVAIGRSQIALPGQAEALAAARTCGGVLAGESAALHWGWKVKTPPDLPVVLVGRNQARSNPTVSLVRRDIPEGWVDGAVLNPVATVVDCARRLPFDAALAIGDQALRSNRVTREAVQSALPALAGRFEKRVGRLLDAADPRADNPFESVARSICLQVPGLHVVPQLQVCGHRGDLVDQELRIVIECDSWEFHSDKEPFRHDVRLYTRRVAEGWIVVRLLWEDVMHRQSWVLAHLDAVVAVAQHARMHTFSLRAPLPTLNDPLNTLNV